MVLENRNTPEYIKFINNVLLKDNYHCVICDSTSHITVHHMNSYDWDVKGRTDINNGVTICDHCHNDFHIEFGYGNNTKEQFYIYYNREHKKFMYKLFKKRKITKGKQND